MGGYTGVFNPQGPIAADERDLILKAVGLMLVIVIPFLITFFVIAWKYRAGNKNAKYEPDRKHGPWRQVLLWAMPGSIILVLSVINWNATHALDPYKPLQSNVKPITIQVVALDWKWLFIYPDQNIATVNFIEFPVATPVSFQLTADAPMNSFWIPQLGGQMYAMAGMVTPLHLMASVPGEYPGKAAEINGAGYAGMTFMAKAVAPNDFDAWVNSVKQSSPALTVDAYNQLSAPSQDVPPSSYSGVQSGLYDNIVMKFMVPSSTKQALDQNGNVIQMIPGMHM